MRPPPTPARWASKSPTRALTGLAKKTPLGPGTPKRPYRPNPDYHPERYGDGGIRTDASSAAPARPEPVQGVIQGRDLVQYDFTPEQYRDLIKLTAALCKVLPQIKCDYPKDAAGKLAPQKLPDADLENYQVDPRPFPYPDQQVGAPARRSSGTTSSATPALNCVRPLTAAPTGLQESSPEKVLKLSRFVQIATKRAKRTTTKGTRHEALPFSEPSAWCCVTPKAKDRADVFSVYSNPEVTRFCDMVTLAAPLQAAEIIRVLQADEERIPGAH